jgi:hypothetical protein
MSEVSMRWVAALGVVFGSWSAYAACTGASPAWASTPDQASVAQCVGSAASGDTVTVSAGSATWSSEVTVTKAMHIHGAGIGNTTITVSAGGFAYLPAAADVDNVFELDGFTFNGNNAFDETGYGQTPPITGFKVHDNAFNNASTGRAVFLAGLEFGVFYRNTFSGNFISVSVIGSRHGGQLPSAVLRLRQLPVLRRQHVR